MIFTLLSHQWKGFWRSRNAGKNLAVQLLLGFVVLYLLSVAIFIGFSLDIFIRKLVPGADEVKVFCGFILYYFALDMVFRFMIQDLPTLAVYPYLPLNIPKATIARFLNIRSLFSVFNILPVILFVPFIIKVVAEAYSATAAFALIIAVLGITAFNHFLLLYLKRKSIISSVWMVVFFIIITLAGLADYFKLFSFQLLSQSIFLYLVRHTWLAAVPVVLAVIAFLNNNVFILRTLYIDEDTRKGKGKTGADYAWLTRFGKMGELMSLDIKLILRNKRPRSLLLLSTIFLFYGFIYFKPEFINKNMLGMILLGAIFVTGMFVVAYGQFLFAWQSSNFDGLMTGSTDIKTYLKAKFMLMQIYSTVALLISLLYGFISWKVIPILFAGYFFNIGITTVVTGYFATMHYKALDLSRSSTFNYQGTSATQWLFSLVIFFIGFVLYFPLGFFINTWAGIITVGLSGIVCYVLQDKLIDFINNNFVKNKYKILEGFREK